MTPIIGRAVRVSLIGGGRVGDFRNEEGALAFTRRVLGDFQVQQEFNFNHSARGAGPGRNRTVLGDGSDQDRRALSSSETQQEQTEETERIGAPASGTARLSPLPPVQTPRSP